MRILVSLSAVGQNPVLLRVLSSEGTFKDAGYSVKHQTRLEQVIISKRGARGVVKVNKSNGNVTFSTPNAELYDLFKKTLGKAFVAQEDADLVSTVKTTGRAKTILPYLRRNKAKAAITKTELEITKDKAVWKTSRGPVFILDADGQATCKTTRLGRKFADMISSLGGLEMDAWTTNHKLGLRMKGDVSSIKSFRHKLLDTFIEKRGHRIKILSKGPNPRLQGMPDKAVAWTDKAGKVLAFVQADGFRALLVGAKSQRVLNRISKVVKTTVGGEQKGDTAVFKSRKKIFDGEYLTVKIGK